MKLSDAFDLTHEEVYAAFLPHTYDNIITEEGEGPRWGFDYPPYRVDPKPEILVLGNYRHPNTGNNLVGGINLHYLDGPQQTALSKALPQIMQPGNLYGRYWAGRRLLPDIFNNFYRTYRSQYINNLGKDVLYPKFGVAKTATNWLKRKLGNIFKTKQQREVDSMPQYPDDITDLQSQFDTALRRQKAAQQIAQTPPDQADTPQMRAARNAFLQYQREKQKYPLFHQPLQPGASTIPVGSPDIDPEDIGMMQAQQDLEQPNTAPPEMDAGLPPEQHEPRFTAQEFERQREENRAELEEPPLESITYYSPLAKRFIVEVLDR